jgi:hypothetical protein
MRFGRWWRSCGRGVVAGGAVASVHGRGGALGNGSDPVVCFGGEQEGDRKSDEVEVAWARLSPSTSWPERDTEGAGTARGVHASNTTCQRSALVEL